MFSLALMARCPHGAMAAKPAPAAFESEALTVAKDFLLKGMPWDLSRPRFIENQRDQIAEKVLGDPRFAEKLRQVALEALRSDQPSTVRRALTALAFVGTDAELAIVEQLKTHEDAAVSRDAATCLYEIKRAAKRGR